MADRKCKPGTDQRSVSLGPRQAGWQGAGVAIAAVVLTLTVAWPAAGDERPVAIAPARTPGIATTGMPLLGYGNVGEAVGKFGLCLLLNYVCVVAQVLGVEALKIANTTFARDPDRHNAFRHCVWAAWVTIEVGASNARWITSIHELDSNDTPLDSAIDLVNNEHGIKIATQVNKDHGGLPKWERYYFSFDSCKDSAKAGELDGIPL